MDHEQGIFDPSRCAKCGRKWPCEIARLLDENALLRSQLEEAGLLEGGADPDDQPVLVLPDPDPIIEARSKELELENAKLEKQNTTLSTRVRQLENRLKAATEKAEEPAQVVEAPMPISITHSDEKTEELICTLRNALWTAKSDHTLSVESWSIVASAFEEETPPCPHEEAIRKHRDARGHERCWLNDIELYQTLHEPIPEPDLPPRCEFLANCEAYYDGHRGDSVPCPHLRRTEELERKLREYGRQI